ncbi:MAG TPA: mechanosensitive ion channel domain-containing protein [Woeseiaceae bacterium]
MTPTINRFGSALARFRLIFFATALLATFPAAGQDAPLSAIAVDDAVDAEQIESAIRAIEAREGLDVETRNKIVEQLRDAQALISRRQVAEAAAESYTKQLEAAPAATARLQAVLQTEPRPPATPESLGIDKTTTLAELQQSLARETAELTAADSRISELKVRIENEQTRPTDAREQINQLRKAREDSAKLTDAKPLPGEPQILADARSLAANLRRAAQGAEINKLERELTSHGIRLELLYAERDVALRSRAEIAQRVDILGEAVNTKRQAAAALARQSAVAASLAATDKHPVVRALAEGNVNLTNELPRRAAEIEVAADQLEQLRAKASDIERRLARSRQHVEIGGMTRAIGQMLMQEGFNLPRLSRHRNEVRHRGSRLAEIGLAQMYYQEERLALTPTDDTLQELITEVAVDVSDPDELAELRSDIFTLLNDRRDLLLQAENISTTYLQVLSDLNIAQRRLVSAVEEYDSFLKQNLLWTPSAALIFTGNWSQVTEPVGRVLSPDAWTQTLAVMVASIGENVGVALVYVLALFALLALRRPMQRKALQLNERIGQLSTDNIGITLASLAIVTIRVLPAPSLFAAAAWFLNAADQDSVITEGVVRSLSALSPFLFNALLFHALCAPQGVLKVHFEWRDQSLTVIRRQFRRLILVGAPLLFITALFFLSDISSDKATLGRLAFFGLMILLTSVSHPLMHPVTGVVTTAYARRPGSWVTRLRWVWYALATGLPPLLGLMSFLGFIYAATILTRLFLNTFWLMLGLAVLNLIVLRWLALSRRKLALQILLKERQAKQAEEESDQDAESEADMQITAEPLDLDKVDQQSRMLLRSVLLFGAVLGSLAVWSEVLPAFTLLDNVNLWTQSATIDGVATTVPVTLADLLLGLLIVAVTMIASHNLPGLMEILILQRLTLEPGSRYAIITLVRYVVIMIGAIFVLNIIGWNWSRIQWLVAALSVGLGFGLQEIVANFVSGIVILFERPVRVGDTVTVGQLTGTVSRIRIRATTIVDWDRKEIIVPNKAFITEQVVNWTLSDPITRVTVPVGIAYGSDVELAHRIIQQTLESLPLVLDNPPPRVLFTGFGDSSLNFTLHVFLRQLTDRLALVDQVHNAVLRVLRENNIEIPFPQRDLHIRSTVEKRKD